MAAVDPSSGDRLRVRGGFAIVPNRLITNPALSHLAVRVFALLSGTYARAHTTCYPSQRRIAADLGLSPRSQRRILLATRQLVAVGALKVTPRHRPDGKRRSNLYTLELCCSAPSTRKRTSAQYAKTRMELRPTYNEEKQKRKAAAAPPQSYRRETTPRRPIDNVNVITKIAHEVLDLMAEVSGMTDSELRDSIKARCRLYRVVHDGATVAKALDSALVQRQRIGKRSPLPSPLPDRRVVPTSSNSVFHRS